MFVPILSARGGWHTDELGRALSQRGHTFVVLPYEGLIARLGTAQGLRMADTAPSNAEACVVPRRDRNAHVRPDVEARLSNAGASLLDADVVLPRIIPGGSLEQVIYRVDALHWIEERGVPVVNSPRAIERSVDKFYTSALLHEAGVPTPETIVCETPDEAVAAVRAMGDVVIKPIFGSMGHGLVRVSDPDVAFRVVKSLAQVHAVFYVQRIVDHPGRDVRAFVVGGTVVGAIERYALDGDWRTNVARGGAAVPFDLPPAWASLALRATTAIGADYAGVDLVASRDGSVFVLEVNGIPGWRGLQAATGVDVAGAIVDHALGRAITRPQPAEARA